MTRSTTHTNSEEQQNILYVLDDEECKSVIRQLNNPKTAKELCDECGIPSSTIYRKLDLLSETPLVTEDIVVRTDGQNTTRYVRTFEELQIRFDPDSQVNVVID